MDVNDKWFVCIKAIPQKDGGIMPLIAEDELVTLNKIKAYCKDELTVDFFAEHFRPAKDEEIPIMLTEFEKKLDACAYFLQHCTLNETYRKQELRGYANDLLEIARKEIEKESVGKAPTDIPSGFWPQKDIDDIIKKTEEGTEKIKNYFSNLIVHDNIRFNYPELYDKVKKEVLEELDAYLINGEWHVNMKMDKKED